MVGHDLLPPLSRRSSPCLGTSMGSRARKIKKSIIVKPGIQIKFQLHQTWSRCCRCAPRLPLEVLATLTLGSRFVEIFGGGVGSPSRHLRDTTREPRCKLFSLKTPSGNYTINLAIGSSLFLAPSVHKLCKKKKEREKLNTFPLSFGYWNMWTKTSRKSQSPHAYICFQKF